MGICLQGPLGCANQLQLEAWNWVLGVNEVSDFLCPEVIWTKSLSYAFICILARKKSSVEISMRKSLSDVYVSLSLSLFLHRSVSSNESIGEILIRKIDNVERGWEHPRIPISNPQIYGLLVSSGSDPWRVWSEDLGGVWEPRGCAGCHHLTVCHP